MSHLGAVILLCLVGSHVLVELRNVREDVLLGPVSEIGRLHLHDIRIVPGHNALRQFFIGHCRINVVHDFQIDAVFLVELGPAVVFHGFIALIFKGAVIIVADL